MIINLFNLLIGFSLILISFSIILNYFNLNKINFFFFLLIFIAGVSRFQFGLVSLGFIHESKPVILRFFIYLSANVFSLSPIFYLRKNELEKHSKTLFIFPHNHYRSTFQWGN